MTTVAIQGELGSFSEAAARRLVDSPALACLSSFEDVAARVAAGEADYAVLPVENAVAGPVLDLSELLHRHGLRVLEETLLPVDQCLIACRPVELERVREVRSHAIALLQCRRFLADHPWMRAVPVPDTAGAVREICAAGDPEVSAIAGPSAAELYGGVILARAIADRPDNATRFVLLAKEDAP